MANATDTATAGDAKSRFDLLAHEWESETRFLSSVQQMALHRAYQQIIGMGPQALPLIFDRMSRQPGHWFWALQSITGEDPVPSEHAGDIAAMTADWLRWARARQLVA